MKYVTPTIELLSLCTKSDIMTISAYEMAAYGNSASFWGATEEEV